MMEDKLLMSVLSELRVQPKDVDTVTVK